MFSAINFYKPQYGGIHKKYNTNIRKTFTWVVYLIFVLVLLLLGCSWLCSVILRSCYFSSENIIPPCYYALMYCFWYSVANWCLFFRFNEFAYHSIMTYLSKYFELGVRHFKSIFTVWSTKKDEFSNQHQNFCCSFHLLDKNL